MGVLYIARCKEELFDSEHIGSVDALLKVGLVTLLVIVDALEAFICHVCCYIEDRMLLPIF